MNFYFKGNQNCQKINFGFSKLISRIGQCFLELLIVIILNSLKFSQENGAGGVALKRDNPHKYLLYKPTVSQFTVFMASGQKELPTNGALMLYISGDGCFSTKPAPEDLSYDLGGVLLSTKRDYELLNSILNR